MEKYKMLMKLCDKAFKKGCVPVGAIILKNGKTISKGYNLRNKTNNVLDHAEIIAINKASKKLKNWNLSECVMYVTMRPCDMCYSIINESRIKEIHYILDNDKYKKIKNDNKKNINFIKENDQNNEYETKLKMFFKKIR